MIELHMNWPRAVPFADLAAAAARRLGPADQPPAQTEVTTLAEAILGAFSAGLVELRMRPSLWSQPATEKPLLWPLVRYQLENGRREVAGLNHTSFRADQQIVREMLLLLDGTRDLAAVAAELDRRIGAGELPLPDVVQRGQLAAEVKRGVSVAAREGLLIA
jgi:hypothetical protein